MKSALCHKELAFHSALFDAVRGGTFIAIQRQQRCRRLVQSKRGQLLSTTATASATTLLHCRDTPKPKLIHHEHAYVYCLWACGGHEPFLFPRTIRLEKNMTERKLNLKAVQEATCNFNGTLPSNDSSTSTYYWATCHVKACQHWEVDEIAHLLLVRQIAKNVLPEVIRHKVIYYSIRLASSSTSLRVSACSSMIFATVEPPHEHSCLSCP